jgi:hypothetical protein
MIATGAVTLPPSASFCAGNVRVALRVASDAGADVLDAHERQDVDDVDDAVDEPARRADHAVPAVRQPAGETSDSVAHGRHRGVDRIDDRLLDGLAMSTG